jgi:putative DNA primase/helicase
MDGNAANITYLQRWAGYTLSGDTREAQFDIWWGGGANGKTTGAEIIARLLGDYAATTPSSTFTARGDDRIPNDVARLAGVRFVRVAETGQGRRLDEALVKQATGGDRVPARFLHREWFEFSPQFKVVLATNHKPSIRGTDQAIWRRIRLVPYTVTIPDEEQDKNLAAKLRDELSGILNWAIEGCLAWQRDGLDPSPDVIAATAAYRSEMDVVAAWIDERCVSAPIAETTAKALYDDYVHWAEVNNERPVSRVEFGTRLAEKGFEDSRGAKGVRKWRGIGLQHEVG